MKKSGKRIKHLIVFKDNSINKILVLPIILLFVITSFSAAQPQNPTTMTTTDDQARGIVWDVTVTFNEPGGAYEYTVFGEAPDANDGPPADAYDVVKPPAPMSSYIHAWFDDNLPNISNNPSPANDNSRDTTYLSIVPSSQTVEYGETFSIIVHLDPGEPVIGVQIDLSFDPSLVQVVSVVKADPVWFFFPPIINNFIGEIHGAAVVVFGTNVSTPIDCFQITFTAQSIDGTSPLILHDVIVTDQNAEPIYPTISNGEVIVGSPINLPPMFGSPSPANGSVNQPLSLTWGIPISDPNGDVFSWTIQCSNGQVSSGTGATNGTKSVSLSGLAYSTTYTVWVNATDSGGSGQYTRRWYVFTTKANLPPVFGSPTPANGSTSQSLSLTWSIPINDPEGDQYSWTIQCNNGQTTSGSGASNGTKSLALSGLAYLTMYKVWVNATDPGGSGQYTRRWYIFTTKTSLPPVFGTPSPSNGSTNNPLSLTWSILISDPEGDLFSWTIQCSNGQVSSGTGASNGTKSLVLSGLAYLTMYKVWVNATDPGGSGLYTRRWYLFTTKANTPPDVPSAPSPANGSTDVSINADLSWTGGDPDPGDTVTYDVYFGTSSSPPKVASNISTTTYDPGTLSYYTYYYWKIVAWDNHGASTAGPRWQFRTAQQINNPPYEPSNPSPANETTEIPINCDLTWTGGDPDGDYVTYDVYFDTSNPPLTKIKSNASGTSCFLDNLNYSQKYYWKVVAWDNKGKSTAGPVWSFTTKRDTSGPSLSITSPKKGWIHIYLLGGLIHKTFPILFTTIVIGSINVNVTASDSQSGMNRVEFYLDNTLMATDYTAPYSWAWEHATFFPYQLTVTAYDNLNNPSTSGLRVWKIL